MSFVQNQRLPYKLAANQIVIFHCRMVHKATSASAALQTHQDLEGPWVAQEGDCKICGFTPSDFLRDHYRECHQVPTVGAAQHLDNMGAIGR